MTNILTVADLGPAGIAEVLALAEQPDLGRPLAGKGVALVFQKPSARTRNSTEMAVVQLGGHPVYIQKEEVGLGSRETAEDVARTLACYHDIICARVMDHDDLVRMTGATAKPVVNLLSDKEHPLQALADVLTMKQLADNLQGLKIAYVGDADNNVARSLAHACLAVGAELTLASPSQYRLSDAPDGVRQVDDPAEAVRRARFVYTDVWVSMGQDNEARERMQALGPYQVDEALMAKADDAWFLHCLPARRGEEVTHGVLESPKSAIWRQAENRMHAARGALAWVLL
ncbi:ornithine carbamoyltransferase [Sphingosinicella sp.]|uniref:ornithine carbamoyltransferase n=1 Tax=Sphingosinicella sp. TaxID=1917971 RepID=UPI004037F87B